MTADRTLLLVADDTSVTKDRKVSVGSCELSSERLATSISDKSSLKQSASLFSTSSETIASISAVTMAASVADDDGFTRPFDLPIASSRRTSSVGGVQGASGIGQKLAIVDSVTGKQDTEEKREETSMESEKQETGKKQQL